MGNSHHEKLLPFVSVVIPAYNAAATLKLCLDSLEGLDYPKDRFEILLIDNGSTDTTLEIASHYNLTVLHENTAQSSYAARNKGILAAKGDLIAFTDADCIVTSEWLKNLTLFWDEKDFGCFAGEIQAYQPETLIEKFSDRENILRQKCTMECPYLPYPQTANAAYRSDVFQKVGIFIPEMTSGGDADIAWRMQKQLGLKIRFIPDALVYHKHRTSLHGLYNQFRKYEHGKFFWTEHYPDFTLSSAEQRKDELVNKVEEHCEDLRNNLVLLMKEEIDFVTFTSSFFRLLMSAGTLKARFEIEGADQLAESLQFGLEERAREMLRLQKELEDARHTIVEKEKRVSEMETRLVDLHRSASWRITKPLRTIADIFNKFFN